MNEIKDSSPLLSIVIVTWNNASCIEDCIVSLEKYEKIRHEIIVVDNCSEDHTIPILKRLKLTYKNIILKQLKENIGYGAANNIGFQIAQGKYTFILNPDVVFIEPVCQQLINVLKYNIDIGIVAPRLLYKDLTFQKSVANFPVTPLYLLNQLHFGKVLPKNIQIKYFQSDYKGLEDRYVDWAIGAALMCRTTELSDVGGFSSDYYMYGEDVRLCKDFAYKLQLKTYYLCSSKLIHIGGESEKQVVGKNKIYYGTWAALHFSEVFYDENERNKLCKEIICENRLKAFLASLFNYKNKNYKKIVSYRQFADCAKTINDKMKKEHGSTACQKK